MTRAKGTKVSPLKIVVTILAVVVVLLFVGTGFQISEESKGRSFDYNIRDYVYVAESGRYGDLYDTAIRDMSRYAKYDADVLQCRALAFYYEQAVLEHAYRTNGDDKKADEFAKRMEEYEAQLGSFAPKAADIRKKLEGQRSGGTAAEASGASAAAEASGASAAAEASGASAAAEASAESKS